MSIDTKESSSPAPQTVAPDASTYFAASEKKREPLAALGNHLLFVDGRFSRETFWLVYISCAVAALVSPLLGPYLFWPAVIALTWVSIVAVIKRFHDRNKSGYWWLVSLIPFAGTLWILIECGLLEGDRKENLYGEKPLGPKDLLA